jgi:hypothetical protein
MERSAPAKMSELRTLRKRTLDKTVGATSWLFCERQQAPANAFQRKERALR